MLTALLLLCAHQTPDPPKLESAGLEGYISMSTPSPPEGYGYGVSLYAAAWPLTEKPLRDFQIGLASIWVIPDNRGIDYPLLPHGTVARDNWPERGPSYRDVFQTIEGGLGFWANTRFGTANTKFRMNGTPNGYNHEICSPGWGFAGDNTKALSPEKMGIVQLSNRILVPPDGFTFKKDTVGDLFGYAWMNLPLTLAKATTAGLPVPTGNNCWTLFLNTTDFKGPVAFWMPATWSRISRSYAPAIARGLDARLGDVTGGAIEINTVPRYVFKDDKGQTFTKIPRLQFPVDEDGRTILIHNLTHYSRSALYDQVAEWLSEPDGQIPTGRFGLTGAVTLPVQPNPLVVKQTNILINGFDQNVKTAVFDKSTFGLQWASNALEPWTSGYQKGAFPQYFSPESPHADTKTAALFNTIGAALAPKSLVDAQFPIADSDAVYTSPLSPNEDGNDVWHQPGPAKRAGPFTVKLTDGSAVTYYWYRFVDQPALQAADLSDADKVRLQRIVEKIQRSWTPDKEYLPKNTMGKLATLDRGMLVKPPKGLEIGYVPIAVGQQLAK